MAPSRWDEEEEESTPPSSPPVAAAKVVRRGKFDDEEEDSDVLDTWEEAEDSEVEREKARKAAEAKAIAETEAKANKKPRAQRIEEKRMESMRQREMAAQYSSDSEDEASRRARLRQMEKEADLKNAEDLFGGIGISDRRGAPKPVLLADPKDPGKIVELSSLKLFNPTSRDEFVALREALVPLVVANEKKPQYPIFVQEYVKQLVKGLPSEKIKEIVKDMNLAFNEKLAAEKAADKGGKTSKAAKTKTTLNAARNTTLKADTNAYNDGLDEDDFM